MLGLNKSKVVGDGYTIFDIPNVENVKLAVWNGGGYITLAGLDKRDIWFALGDRPDLKPKELENFGLTSCRTEDKAEQESFVKKVVEIFGN